MLSASLPSKLTLHLLKQAQCKKRIYHKASIEHMIIKNSQSAYSTIIFFYLFHSFSCTQWATTRLIRFLMSLEPTTKLSISAIIWEFGKNSRAIFLRFQLICVKCIIKSLSRAELLQAFLHLNRLLAANSHFCFFLSISHLKHNANSTYSI